MKKTLLLTSIFMLITGCSSKYPITYNTTPDGAILVCNGQNMGYTPVTLYYTPEEGQKVFQTQPCVAHWSSGATANFPTLWDLTRFPNGVRHTLTREKGPGYEQDVQFSLQVQNMRYLQRQTEAAESQARAARSANFQQNLRDNTPKFYNVSPNYMGGYSIMQY